VHLISGGGVVAEPKRAGRSGGLLFVLVALFVAYLAVRAVAGVIRFVIVALIVAVVVALVANVMRRRCLISGMPKPTQPFGARAVRQRGGGGGRASR